MHLIDNALFIALQPLSPEHFPAWLRALMPFGLALWQLLALPLVAALAAAFGWLAGKALHAPLAAAARRTTIVWDDLVLERIAAPLNTALGIAAFILLLPLLAPPPAVAAGLRRGAAIALIWTFFWAAWRLIEVTHHVMQGSRWARRVPSSRALVPLGARMAKVMLLILGLITALSLAGYPVTSLLAGLGIGGLAVALAAQKTVENLFGAFSIGVDQPFREGDFVKIEDFVGTVEAIGLRSTRFRTLDRTVVSIPNGRLADMRLESFTERDRLRLATVIGLVYSTTTTQMREVLQGLERVLRAHPKIWPGAVVVRFREFAASSLDIEIMAWFQTSDWGEFQGIRQEVLIDFMGVVERAGTSFAFPTRTVHVVAESPSASTDGRMIRAS